MKNFSKPFLILITFFLGCFSTLLATTLLATTIFAHGGDLNLIHACVKNNGNIRIIAANGTCLSSETPLDWNIQGPPGPAGISDLPLICPGCNLVDVGDRLAGKNLTNAYLAASGLPSVNLQGTNFTDADLHGADLTGANITGVIWSNTICPDETNSDDNGGTCEGHI